MKLTYDPQHNIAYIRFREKAREVESVRLSDEVTIDIAPDGSVYGIELLNANEQLGAADAGVWPSRQRTQPRSRGHVPLMNDATLVNRSPDVIAAEIVENLEAALTQFRQVATALGGEDTSST